MKKLKQYSYNVQWGTYDKHQLFISASSQKQVIELLEKIGIRVSISDVRNYFGSAWGNSGNEAMEGIEITEPCIYAIKGTRFDSNLGKPIKLI